MPPLSWRHQTLIQSLLSRGPLKEDDFRSIFSQVTGRTSVFKNQLFNDFLRKINEELSYVQFELRACRNQLDGSVYYGVVNNVSDAQSELGTKYTLPQIAFYKGIVDAITQDAEARGCVSSTDALYVRLEAQVHGMTESQSQEGNTQLPPAFKNFSMTQKEKTLELLVKDQWLCMLPDGKIGIGVKTFLDLRSWFRTNEVPSCEVCNEAAVKARLCQNDTCNVRIHLYCLKKKFSQPKVEKVCPGCGTQWPGLSVKAEALEQVNNEPDVPSQNTQPLKPSINKRRKSHQVANTDSAASDYSSQTSDVAPDIKRVTRRSTRLSANVEIAGGYGCIFVAPRGVSTLKKTFLPISGDGAATSAINNNSKSSRSKLQEYEEKLYGITDLLIEFVKSFSIETFSNFRIVEEEGNICNSGHLGNVRTDLSEWQEIHAKLALSRIKELAELRFRLCPRYLKEWQFWRIYFALVRSYVAEFELEAARLAEIERIKMGTDGSSSKNSACEVEMLEAKFTPSVEPET